MLEYSWDVDKNDPMIITVMHRGERVLRIFIGEAMEYAGRRNVMKHVAECDRSPWITTWERGPAADTMNALKQS